MSDQDEDDLEDRNKPSECVIVVLTTAGHVRAATGHERIFVTLSSEIQSLH